MSITRGALAATTALGLVLAAAPLTANAAAAATGASYDLSEVVVVAQRRAERLQDVPISITAIQGKDLEAAGIGKASELSIVTPGLNMATTGNYVQPVIRGIGSNITQPAAESNVATYVDGAYQVSLVGSTLDLPDVSSVEVLKGPQGTLFGRNATGGAILVNTKAPDLSAMHGTAYLSYGNYNSFVAKGFITAPIIQDKLAFSLSSLYDWTDGWKKNLIPGAKQNAAVGSYLIRAKLRFLPWEGADFTLTGLYSRKDDRSTSKTSNFQGNSGFRPGAPLGFFPNPIIPSAPWTYSTDAQATTRKATTGFILHGDIEAGPGKISTTTTADRSNEVLNADVDDISVPAGTAKIFSHPKSFSQELLYTTNQLGRFRGVGGLYYFRSDVPNGTTLRGALGNQGIYSFDKDRSYAAFGELTFNVTEQLVVTGGLRYSTEKRISNAAFAVAPADITMEPTTRFFPQDLSHTWHAWTPRVSALYKITPRSNVYATFSKGFTSGLYNTTGRQVNPVNPEHVKAYEVGIKSNEIRNINVSVAGFYYDYTDLQTNHTVFDAQGIHNEIGNAAKAKIKGVEFNGQWRASDNFDLTAGATFISAKYSKYVGAPVSTPLVLANGQLGGNFASNPNGVDISGTRMIRTPKFSGNLTGHYHQDFNMGTVEVVGTAFYSTKLFWDYGERIPQKAYTLLNGSVSFKPAGSSNVKLTVWGKNLGNKAVLSSGSFTVLYDTVDYLPPRTYGVSVQYDF